MGQRIITLYNFNKKYWGVDVHISVQHVFIKYPLCAQPCAENNLIPELRRWLCD